MQTLRIITSDFGSLGALFLNAMGYTHKIQNVNIQKNLYDTDFSSCTGYLHSILPLSAQVIKHRIDIQSSQNVYKPNFF